MTRHIQESTNQPEKRVTPEVRSWLNFLKTASLVSPHNEGQVIASIGEAKENNVPLQFVLTFCPAIRNLRNPNDRGQTRELIKLESAQPRLRRAVEELISFMAFTKQMVGVSPEVFLIFADELEPDAERMFINANRMVEITEASLSGIRKTFSIVDQENPGLLQSMRIKIPKIRKQTDLRTQAMKVGINPEQEISKRELEMLDPRNPLFDLWEKHLLLTRNDQSFVSTGWQNKKGAESIWTRVRFMLAQCIVDGEILPKLITQMREKSTVAKLPTPIFIASTTREAGVLLEMDGFNARSQLGVIAPFHNIGRWVDDPKDSPWLSTLGSDILKKENGNK